METSVQGPTIRDPELTARVEEYVERSREHHRRLIRWTASVFPLPLIFGPRLIEQMSRSMRTDIIYTYAGLVAVLGVAVCVSVWRFHRAYDVRCPVCGAKLSADAELFLRVGECPSCVFRSTRAAVLRAQLRSAAMDVDELPMNSWAEVYIELYPAEAGGRQTPLDLCNERPGSYRPHFRALARPSELVGVEFMDGPDDPVLPGESTSATVRFLYEPRVSYQALTLGAEFEIMEGPRSVGRAEITRLD